jgi:hypothetical protein
VLEAGEKNPPLRIAAVYDRVSAVRAPHAQDGRVRNADEYSANYEPDHDDPRDAQGPGTNDVVERNGADSGQGEGCQRRAEACWATRIDRRRCGEDREPDAPEPEPAHEREAAGERPAFAC